MLRFIQNFKNMDLIDFCQFLADHPDYGGAVEKLMNGVENRLQKGALRTMFLREEGFEFLQKELNLKNKPMAYKLFEFFFTENLSDLTGQEIAERIYLSEVEGPYTPYLKKCVYNRFLKLVIRTRELCIQCWGPLDKSSGWRWFYYDHYHQKWSLFAVEGNIETKMNLVRKFDV